RNLGAFRSCELPYKQNAWKSVSVALVLRNSICQSAVIVLGILDWATGGVPVAGGGVMVIPIRLAILVTITEPPAPFAVVLLPFAPVTQATVPLAPPTGDFT